MAVRPAVTVTFATVRRLGLALPDVEEGTAYGSPALKLRGQLLACVPANKAAEPSSLGRVPPDALRDLLKMAWTFVNRKSPRKPVTSRGVGAKRLGRT